MPQYLSMIPWVGGLAQFGHSTTKQAHALSECTDWVFELDGTKVRRGGQARIHRIPFRDGRFQDHFLDTSATLWEQTDGDVTFTYGLDSIVRGVATGTNIDPGYLSTDLPRDDDDTLPVLREVVQTLSSTPGTAAEQTTLLAIAFRTKFAELPPYTAGSWRLLLDPGRHTGGSAEWYLDLRFGSNGISQFYSGGDHEISTDASTNVFSTTSAAFIDNQWHDWRLDITYDGANYQMAVYVHEVQLYAGIALATNTSDTAGSVRLQWTAGGSAGQDIDAYVDYIEIDADVAPIYGLAEYRPVADSPVRSGRIAAYAGTKVLIQEGYEHNTRCIDQGITGDLMSFANFQDKLIYTSSDRTRPRKWNQGLAKGVEIGTAPIGSILRVHANRLWLAGNYLYPSRIYWSALLSETSWNDGRGLGETFTYDEAGYADVDPDDAERVTALSPSYRGIMVIYKERSIYRLDGTTPLNFSLSNITKTIGCVSHNTVVNVGNDQFFVSRHGVHSLQTTDQYGDVESLFLSSGIREFWDEKISIANLDLAWAFHNEKLDRYELLVPVLEGGYSGRELNYLLTFHYSVRPEGFPTGIWSIKKISGGSAAMVQRATDERQQAFVGGRDGYINLQDRSHPFDFPVFDV